MKKKITIECLCNKFPDIKTPCCNFFKQMLNDCHMRLTYLPHHNMYGIKIVGTGSTQGIQYCPWCGTKFPEWTKYDDNK